MIDEAIRCDPQHAEGPADVEVKGLVCNGESCNGAGMTLAGDSNRFTAGYFSGGVDGMCLGGEGGGVDGEVSQDRFTVGLLCGRVTGMQRRENGSVHYNGRLRCSRHWRFDMQRRMWEGDRREGLWEGSGTRFGSIEVEGGFELSGEIEPIGFARGMWRVR